MQDMEFSKEKLLEGPLYKEREERIVKNVKNARKDKKQKKGEKDPRKSAEVSFDAFKEGKTVQEIAAERSLTTATIESHLVPYVAKGLIDVFRLVDRDKVEKILEVAAELDTLYPAPIKNRLGDEVSYNELRFVLAYKLAGT
jgi:uncharacterized protein YpbB